MQDDNQFIEEYRVWVEGIVQRLRKLLNLHCDVEDLRAAGFEGLLQARTRFDPDRNVRFSTFAYYRVRGAVVDCIRSHGYAPAHVHAKLKALSSADEFGAQAVDRQGPGDAQPAPPTEHAARTIHDRLSQINASFVLAAVAQDEQSAPPDPEAQCIREERRAQLRAVMKGLPDKEQQLLQAMYFSDLNLLDAASSVGISPSWACRMHARALRRLREALESPCG